MARQFSDQVVRGAKLQGKWQIAPVEVSQQTLTIARQVPVDLT